MATTKKLPKPTGYTALVRAGYVQVTDDTTGDTVRADIYGRGDAMGILVALQSLGFDPAEKVWRGTPTMDHTMYVKAGR